LSHTRVLVLATGGTICMAPAADGSLAPSPDFLAQLSATLTSICKPWGNAAPSLTIEALEPAIDSADATPQDWWRMAAALCARWQDVDAFIVLHGTDTLAYTASALSFLLANAHKPVVLTGSQVPLALPDTDAPANLRDALLAACNPPRSGVFIAFGGLLLAGNRASKRSNRDFQAFYSPNAKAAPVPAPREQVSQSATQPGGLAAVPAPHSTPTLPALPPANALVYLPWVPGLAIAQLEAVLASAPRAILLGCYGSGSVGLLGSATERFLHAARERDIVLTAITQCEHGNVSLGRYAVSSVLNRAGVIGGADMTLEAAYAKLQVLIARGLDSSAIRAAFAANLAGELTA
jgi:L-asparaginase